MSPAARRRVAIVLAAVGVLLGLFYGAGGWYFAGQIRSDALAVEARPQDEGQRPAGAAEVTYPCGVGDCPAWRFTAYGSTWAILVHGRAASRTEPLHGVDAARRANMPAVDITYRNDPGAPPDPSGFYWYGRTEWTDLAGAVRYAKDHGATHAVLFGYSMGGAIVASYLRHAPDDGFVRGVVLDSPVLDFGRTIDFGAAHRSLPLVGLPIPGSLVAVAKSIAGHRFGIDYADLDYIDPHDGDPDWLDVPALVFHGDDDRTVPLSTSKSFAAAQDGEVKLVITRGAEHVGSWQADPAGYDRTLDEFLGPLR